MQALVSLFTTILLLKEEAQRVFIYFSTPANNALGFDFVMTEINLPPTQSANMSSSLKFQELPEFRVQNSRIETSVKEEIIRRPSRFSTEYYTKLKIAETPVHTDDPFLQEYAHSAKSILSLLKLRDKYMFSHCQCIKHSFRFFVLTVCVIDTLIKDLIEPRKNSQEPTINYLKENRRLPKMENVLCLMFYLL